MARAGLIFVAFWFVVGGLGHFVFTDTLVSVTPAWVPEPRWVVLATGVAEVVGGLALFSARLHRWAGLALIAFTICVTPVHIEMLQHAERYPSLGEPALWARLLFQPVLIWIIWGVTLTPPRSTRQ